MTRRRFIADRVTGDRAVLLGAHAAHLSRVLRAHPGQQFDLAVNGSVRRGLVVRVEDERVEFELGDEIPAEIMLPVRLYLSIMRFERMEWAIEKCVELGVTCLVPMVAARSDPRLVAAAAKRIERWQRLILQAAEQSRRSAPPELAPAVPLRQGVLCEQGTRIVLDETERSLLLGDVLQERANRDCAPSDSAVALAVGPEGGWTEAERKLFSDSGWTSASLGHNILRSETAAVAALALVMSLAR
jgi:16S rRNA (uracil1498-N3)-methyltransferase